MHYPREQLGCGNYMTGMHMQDETGPAMLKSESTGGTHSVKLKPPTGQRPGISARAADCY